MWTNGSRASAARNANALQPPRDDSHSDAAPREYPVLAPCRLVLLHPGSLPSSNGGAGGGANSKTTAGAPPPARLPAGTEEYCRSLVHAAKRAGATGGTGSAGTSTSMIPPTYDFQLENQILSDHEDRRRQHLDGLTLSQSKEELRRSVVAKMRGVTNADESICVSILETNSYDLKTSIEAYFQSP